MSQGKRIADIAEAIVTADRLLSGKPEGRGS
jgi:hypothetical protein